MNEIRLQPEGVLNFEKCIRKIPWVQGIRLVKNQRRSLKNRTGMSALRDVSICAFFSWQTVYSWGKGPAWVYTLHRSRHLCEAYVLNIWGDLMMLFMQTRCDRFGRSPRQIQKGSLSKPGIIPFLSTKTPSESHLPKQCGFFMLWGIQWSFELADIIYPSFL